MQQFAPNFNCLSTNQPYDVDLAAEGFGQIEQEEFEAHHVPLGSPSIEQADAEAAGYADAAKPRHKLKTFAEFKKLYLDCGAAERLVVKGVSDPAERQRKRAEAWKPKSDAIVADVRAAELGNATGALVGQDIGRLKGRQTLVLKASLRASIAALRGNAQPIDSSLMLLLGALADNESGACTISLGRIARVFNRSQQAVTDAIKRIKDAKRVDITRTGNGTYHVKPRVIPADLFSHGLNLVEAFEGMALPKSTRNSAPHADRASAGKFARRTPSPASSPGAASVCSREEGTDFPVPQGTDIPVPILVEETLVESPHRTERQGRAVDGGVTGSREEVDGGSENPTTIETGDRAANENVAKAELAKPEPTTWTSEVQATAIKITRFVNRKVLRANFEAYVGRGSGTYRQWLKGLSRADETYRREVAANLVTADAIEAFCTWERDAELKFLRRRGHSQKRLPDATIKSAIADFLASETGKRFPLHRGLMPSFSGGVTKLSNALLSLLGDRLGDLKGEPMVKKAHAILGPDLERKARLSTFLAGKEVPKHIVAADFEWTFQREAAESADRQLVARVAGDFGIPEHESDLAWFAGAIRRCDERLLAKGARWSADLVATLLFSLTWRIDPARLPTANAAARLGKDVLANVGFVFSDKAAA